MELLFLWAKRIGCTTSCFFSQFNWIEGLGMHQDGTTWVSEELASSSRNMLS